MAIIYNPPKYQENFTNSDIVEYKDHRFTKTSIDVIFHIGGDAGLHLLVHFTASMSTTYNFKIVLNSTGINISGSSMPSSFYIKGLTPQKKIFQFYTGTADTEPCLIIPYSAGSQSTSSYGGMSYYIYEPEITQQGYQYIIYPSFTKILGIANDSYHYKEITQTTTFDNNNKYYALFKHNNIYYPCGISFTVQNGDSVLVPLNALFLRTDGNNSITFLDSYVAKYLSLNKTAVNPIGTFGNKKTRTGRRFGVDGSSLRVIQGGDAVPTTRNNDYYDYRDNYIKLQQQFTAGTDNVILLYENFSTRTACSEEEIEDGCYFLDTGILNIFGTYYFVPTENYEIFVYKRSGGAYLRNMSYGYDRGYYPSEHYRIAGGPNGSEGVPEETYNNKKNYIRPNYISDMFLFNSKANSINNDGQLPSSGGQPIGSGTLLPGALAISNSAADNYVNLPHSYYAVYDARENTDKGYFQYYIEMNMEYHKIGQKKGSELTENTYEAQLFTKKYTPAYGDYPQTTVENNNMDQGDAQTDYFKKIGDIHFNEITDDSSVLKYESYHYSEDFGSGSSVPSVSRYVQRRTRTSSGSDVPNKTGFNFYYICNYPDSYGLFTGNNIESISTDLIQNFSSNTIINPKTGNISQSTYAQDHRECYLSSNILYINKYIQTLSGLISTFIPHILYAEYDTSYSIEHKPIIGRGPLTNLQYSVGNGTESGSYDHYDFTYPKTTYFKLLEEYVSTTTSINNYQAIVSEGGRGYTIGTTFAGSPTAVYAIVARKKNTNI